MPNAKDIKRPPKFIIDYGPTGSGKTTLFTTIPGKKLALVFDPGSLDTLAGQDLDYEYFPPGSSLGLRRTQKGRTDTKGSKLEEPLAFNKFDVWYENALRTNLLTQYDAIGFHSLTILQMMIMDRILWINGRWGATAELGDYNLTGLTMNAIISTTIEKVPSATIFLEAHDDLVQDEISKKVHNVLDLYKGSRKALPRLCTDVLVASAEAVDGKAVFRVQAQPSREYPAVKNSFGLPLYTDVTLKPGMPRTEQGIGSWMKKGGGR